MLSGGQGGVWQPQWMGHKGVAKLCRTPVCGNPCRLSFHVLFCFTALELVCARRPLATSPHRYGAVVATLQWRCVWPAACFSSKTDQCLVPLPKMRCLAGIASAKPWRPSSAGRTLPSSSVWARVHRNVARWSAPQASRPCFWGSWALGSGGPWRAARPWSPEEVWTVCLTSWHDWTLKALPLWPDLRETP